ncbi:hypothetical protein ACOSP7_031304 [Xanthoceras sorbifolium]
MFCSELWDQCKWSNTTKGQKAYATVMSTSFWNGVTTCLKVFAPLVKVLRLVDGDKKPAMGFVYGELLQAKEDIKVALNNRLAIFRTLSETIQDIFRVSDTLFGNFRIHPINSTIAPLIHLTSNLLIIRAYLFTFILYNKFWKNILQYLVLHFLLYNPSYGVISMLI